MAPVYNATELHHELRPFVADAHLFGRALGLAEQEQHVTAECVETLKRLEQAAEYRILNLLFTVSPFHQGSEVRIQYDAKGDLLVCPLDPTSDELEGAR